MRDFSRYIVVIVSTLLFCTSAIYAQFEKPIEEMSREDVLSLDYDALVELPLDKLLQLAEIAGVSLEELYEMLLNKDVSTASKRAENSFESPLSATVISSEEIMQSGATTIPEVLRQVPGLIVRQETNGNFDIHIRGNDYIPPGEMLVHSENFITLVMIDNRPVYNYFSGGTFWEILPVELIDIDRIEIIRGPCSALYGPNAVSGVIHIITKEPTSKKLKIKTNAQGGNQNTATASGLVQFGLGKRWNFQFSGNYQTRNRFDNTYYSFISDDYISGDALLEDLKYFEHGLNAEEAYPDYDLAQEKYAANGKIHLSWKNIKIKFDFGGQKSTAQTGFIDMASFLTFRESESVYSDIKAKIFGLNLHTSTISGRLNAARGAEGFEYNYNEVNNILDYEFKWDKLSIRPGIATNNAYYTDSFYVDVTKNEGFLNGKKILGSVSVFLRTEYTLFDKLRLVAAINQGFYYKPERTYTSYQFVSSYKIDDNNLIRFVYSKANTSPFIADTYANYQGTFDLKMPRGIAGAGMFLYEGNDDLDLIEMKLTELGFRNKLRKNIYSDFEFFHTRSKNYSMQVDYPTEYSLFLNDEPVETFPFDSIYMREYSKRENVPVQSNQIGITGSISVVFGKNFNMKLFGTLQQTYLTDHQVRDSVVLEQLTGIRAASDSMLHTNPAHIDLAHKYTPTLYGGFVLNYSPISKLNINTNGYFITEQKINYGYRQLEELTIHPKLIWNIKIGYNFWKHGTVYFNGRNILNDRTKEAVYADNIGGLYLLGMSFSF